MRLDPRQQSTAEPSLFMSDQIVTSTGALSNSWTMTTGDASIWWGVVITEAIGSLVLACALPTLTHADYFRAIISFLWTGLWLVALFSVAVRERGSDFVIDLSLNLASALLGLWLTQRYTTRIFGSARVADG
jgi:hypothetical protein